VSPADAPVVLVTGATGLLGRAAIARFARDGARLVLVGTDRGRLDALVADTALEPDRHLLLAADLREREAARGVAERAQDRFGRIDVLLHLVGGFEGGTAVVDLDPDEVRRMLDQHLWTTLNIVAAVVPGMTARRFGRVLAVSSPVAANPGPRGASYAMAKAAEEVILRSLAREAAGTGVTANLLVVRSIANPAAAPGSAPAGTPPDEMAEVLAFLASPAAATVTGQRIALGG
jgi:NAD(P)-dependent dehydrogenase (short-subunit alcohol dehydrogenase family)